MCGIAGVRRYGDNPINAEEIKILLQSLEHRGNHATGIALVVGREIKIIKDNVPAWTFCGRKDTNEFLDAFLPQASIALLHTRYASVGSPEDNRNNHPMFLGKAAVVHNGTISNHNYVFDQMKVPRSCETDSDVFRAIIDKEGLNEKGIKCMNGLVGSAAIAAVTADNPDLLLLARSGSPLCYGITADKLWWASEINAIQRAVRPWVEHHGLHARQFRSDVAYFGVPDNTAYLLTKKGLDHRFEFKTCVNYRAPLYNMRQTYQSKQDEFKREKRLRRLTAPVEKPKVSEFTHKAAVCPKDGCNIRCKIPVANKFADHTCPACKITLRALDALKDTDLIFITEVE